MIQISLFLLAASGFLAGPGAWASGWSDSFHGNANLTSTDFPDEVNPTNRFLETARFSFDDTLKYQKTFRVKFTPLIQADPLNYSPSERYWFDVPNGYFQILSSGFTIQVGYNTFNWGVTDGFNPLDVVSARRYQDPFAPDKLGAPSISVKKEMGKFSIEGLFIPFQRKSILPGVNSRWLPRQVFSTNSFTVPASFPGGGSGSALIYLPNDLSYSFQSDEEVDRALENNFGFRTQINGLLPGLDVSLEGFEGAGSTPAILVGASGNVLSETSNLIVIQANPLVNLTPVYYRQYVYGGSMVYAHFGMIFRTEAAFTRLISKSVGLPGDSEEYVLGIEKPIPIGGQDLTLLLMGTYARHADPISNSTTSLNRIFDRAVILGGRYSFSERLTVLASGLYDTESHGELAHVEASYGLTDASKIGIAGDALWGSPETPLGTYRLNDRASVSLKTAF